MMLRFTIINSPIHRSSSCCRFDFNYTSAHPIIARKLCKGGGVRWRCCSEMDYKAVTLAQFLDIFSNLIGSPTDSNRDCFVNVYRFSSVLRRHVYYPSRDVMLFVELLRQTCFSSRLSIPQAIQAVDTFCCFRCRSAPRKSPVVRCNAAFPHSIKRSNRPLSVADYVVPWFQRLILPSLSPVVVTMH